MTRPAARDGGPEAPAAAGHRAAAGAPGLRTAVDGRGGLAARLAAVPARGWLALMAVTGPLAVGIALLTQHIGGLQPCPWCVLQRLEFLAVSALALLAWGLPSPWLRRAVTLAAGAMALAGLATALWQHFVAAASNSCKLTLADRVMSSTGLDERWPEVFAAWASCADAKVSLLGLPYEFWSGALFVALAAMAVLALRRPARR